MASFCSKPKAPGCCRLLSTRSNSCWTISTSKRSYESISKVSEYNLRFTHINFCPHRLPNAILPGFGQGTVAAPQGGFGGLLAYHLHLDLLVCFAVLLALDEQSVVMVSLGLCTSTARNLEPRLEATLGGSSMRTVPRRWAITPMPIIIFGREIRVAGGMSIVTYSVAGSNGQARGTLLILLSAPCGSADTAVL